MLTLFIREFIDGPAGHSYHLLTQLLRHVANSDLSVPLVVVLLLCHV
jgi:hypothetical protein